MRSLGSRTLLLAALAVAASLGTATSAFAVFDGIEPVSAARGLDFDRRGDAVGATDAQRAAVRALGARATYNAYGTPSSLISDTGPLADGVAGADGPAKARTFLKSAAGRAIFRLTDAQVDDLELLHDRPLGDRGRAVLLRQRFGSLEAGAGSGQIAVALRDADVVYASSTLAPGDGSPGAAALTAQAAYLRAAQDLGVDVDASDISNLRVENGFNTFDVAGVSDPGRAKLVALPLPGGAVRPAFQTVVVKRRAGDPLAATTYVDADTGRLVLRSDNVDHAVGDPEFDVFPANPPINSDSSTDTRQRWCWVRTSCARQVGPSGTPERTGEWDTLQPSNQFDGPAVSSGATLGNAARSEDASESTFLSPGPTLNPQPVDPTTNRVFGGPTNAPWTNAWRTNRCSTTNLTSANTTYPDVAAAKVNLFVLHNRMHDWAYRLGFTEAAYNLQVNNFGRGGQANDSELGDVQAGATSGGSLGQYEGRDNANQITLDDGIAPITNMYLWQPIAAAFYSPCVDGDFDMSVVGHEYTHAISNRMVGGPSAGLDTTEGGSMGESFSDLDAVEYLNAYGFVPTNGEEPYSVGAYVTGDKRAGIRNYVLDDNPLNYSDIGYDVPGAEVHSDGEVWSAVNFEVRGAMQRRYDAGFPSGDRFLQERCAEGTTPVAQCPGNRRWVQMFFDAFLLMQSDVNMVTARDAYLAADRARFGGANQDLLWDAFAKRGLGEDARADTSIDTQDVTDVQPRPSFSSPISDDDTTVVFAPGAPKAQLFVGDYEARTTPIADTDPATALGPDEPLRPGTYSFVARADGYGSVRFKQTIPASRTVRLEVPMAANFASANAGARATGDAIQPGTVVDPTAEPADPNALLRNLIDDTESTNWASRVSSGTIAGQQVTVDLAGGAQLVDRVQVSALLRSADPNDTGGDTETQNRFTALRRFALEACTASAANNGCAAGGSFQRFYTSPSDAFPSGVPRPRVPELNLRGFDVPDTRMTHLRMVALSNQCTGAPDYQGEQDADPTNETDCDAVSERGTEIRAAELQAFSSPPVAARLVDVTGAGTTAAPRGTTPATTGPVACASSPGFRTAAVRRVGRGLRFAFTRASSAKADVDVFQVARGRKISGERLVARFRNRTKAFSWDGKANRRGRRVGDGYYVVRLRTKEGDGLGTDTRRTAMRRVGGRFRSRPAYYGRTRCATIRQFKLERPVFGGTATRSLGASFQVNGPARVTLRLLRGKRTLRTYARGTIASAKTQRLRIPARGRARGDYRVRITVTAGGKTTTQTLTARRL